MLPVKCLPIGILVASLMQAAVAMGRQDIEAIDFKDHTIATGLKGGYQVVATDLNRDGKPDLIALASGLDELVWYENPGWQRHVLAAGLSGLINLAAHDLDGDGIPELALATGFSTTPEKSSGEVSILTHQGDPTELWSIREIDRIPTSHRLRWIDPDGSGRKWLVNGPLVGPESRPPEYRGRVSIFIYHPGDWKRSVVTDAEEGVVHGIEPVSWQDTKSEALLSAGFLGLHLYQQVNGRWTPTLLHAGDPSDWPRSGASDVAMGRLGKEPFIVTIEPWHGHQVVVYRRQKSAWLRQVIDAGLTDGHALAVGDLDGDHRDEIIAGERQGSRVTMYRSSPDLASWSRHVLDEGGMAAAGCAVVDLNLHGRLDVVCIGTATANLKWYENQ